MSLVATVEALVAAGATGDIILAVVRVHEAQREAALVERREKDAARKKAERVRNGHAESRGHADETPESSEPSPHAGARTQVVIPSLPSLRSEELVVGGVGVERERAPQTDDWPKGNGPHLAKLLIDAAGSPWLDLARSPDLHTTVGRLLAWKREGASWEHDVLPVVTGLCANRRSRISSWKFFDQAVARSIAENRAALEIPEARVVPLRPGGENLTDRIAAEHAEARRRVLEG